MKTIETKVGSKRSRSLTVGLVLVVTGLAAQSMAVSPEVASADGGRNDHRTADVAFTGAGSVDLP